MLGQWFSIRLEARDADRSGLGAPCLIPLVAGQVSKLGGRAETQAPRCPVPYPGGVQGSPITSSPRSPGPLTLRCLGEVLSSHHVSRLPLPRVCTVRSCFCFHREHEHGLEYFHLLTTLAKLILFNYLPGLSLNTFCVKFTVFPFQTKWT